MNRADTRAAALLPLIVADVYDLAGRFRAEGETLAKAAGQTQSRWQVLSAASGEPRTVPQIARRLGVTRQNVQRLADRLVAEKLAAYAANPDHKGSPHLVLSEKGRAALARIGAKAGAWHAALAARLEDREIAAAHALLRKFLAALDELERAPVARKEK